MRVLRDDADQARAALSVALMTNRPAEERDRSVQIGKAHATLALAEAIGNLTEVADAIFGEVAREWVAFKLHRHNGATPTREGRKV